MLKCEVDRVIRFFNFNWHVTVGKYWPVVVTQLVEWPFPIPEVRGLNPVIGKI